MDRFDQMDVATVAGGRRESFTNALTRARRELASLTRQSRVLSLAAIVVVMAIWIRWTRPVGGDIRDEVLLATALGAAAVVGALVAVRRIATSMANLRELIATIELLLEIDRQAVRERR